MVTPPRGAPTGTAALEALENQSFDLVLMDMQMPKMGGPEATIAVRERERVSASGQHIPIIAMTANAMVGDKEQCIESLVPAGVELSVTWEPVGVTAVRAPASPRPPA